MKVNGPNHTNVNPYQQQIQKKQTSHKSTTRQEDQLQISNKAKEMQANDSRQAYVKEIQQQIETGEYKVNVKETARKILNFWK